MSERNDADGFNKSRSVLGDVTNRLGKRGFSEREKSGVKSYSLSDKDTVKHVRVSPRRCTDLDLLKGDVLSRSSKVSTDALTMRNKIGSRNCKDPSFTNLEMARVINPVDSKSGGSIPLGRFDSLNGYKMLKIPNAVTENTSPNLKGTVKRNVVDVARNRSGDVVSSMTKISESSYLNLLDLGRDNAFRCANIKDKNKLGDVASANTSSSVSDTGSDCLLDCINCNAGAAKVSLEGTQKNFINYPNEVKGHNADNCIMSQSDSIDCAILPDSQESRIFGVEKSSESKKCKEYPYIGGGVDAIKTCSCSFCTKAAYIWLDLNYQDIRGRVSAMRKSQKEACILAERSRMTHETEKHDAEGSTRISKLEFDVMHQWRFLFQHMAGIWEQEGDHLETSLSPLTDLREKCKRDLCSG